MNNAFEFPKPSSMTASEAASWYRAMIPLIPQLEVDEAYGDDDWEFQCNIFIAHWNTKCRLRLAAALAMYDQELVSEFFQKFPLPSAMEYVGRSFTLSEGKSVLEAALTLLLAVSDAEKRAFPGTIGESIGLECHARDGIYVMTEDGWKKKE